MRPRHLPEQVKQQLLKKYENEEKLSFVKDTIYELKQPGTWRHFRRGAVHRLKSLFWPDFRQNRALLTLLSEACPASPHRGGDMSPGGGDIPHRYSGGTFTS